MHVLILRVFLFQGLKPSIERSFKCQFRFKKMIPTVDYMKTKLKAFSRRPPLTKQHVRGCIIRLNSSKAPRAVMTITLTPKWIHVILLRKPFAP